MVRVPLYLNKDYGVYTGNREGEDRQLSDSEYDIVVSGHGYTIVDGQVVSSVTSEAVINKAFEEATSFEKCVTVAYKGNKFGLQALLQIQQLIYFNVIDIPIISIDKVPVFLSIKELQELSKLILAAKKSIWTDQYCKYRDLILASPESLHSIKIDYKLNED